MSTNFKQWLILVFLWVPVVLLYHMQYIKYVCAPARIDYKRTGKPLIEHVRRYWQLRCCTSTCPANTTCINYLRCTCNTLVFFATHVEICLGKLGYSRSKHLFKCISFILWTLTILCWVSLFGTCQNSVYFPLPGSQAAAAGSFLGRFSATLCLALFPTPQPIILRSIKHVSKLKEHQHHSPRSTPNRIFFRSIKHVSSARNVYITDPASPPHPSIARRTPDGKNHLKQRDRYWRREHKVPISVAGARLLPLTKNMKKHGGCIFLLQNFGEIQRYPIPLQHRRR